MLWKFMFYNFEEKKSSVFNQNLIFCNFDHLGCFRSVGNRWFWCGRRGETWFSLPVLLWRLWHRVFVFSSWRWTFLWIKSHGRSLFFLISDFHFLPMLQFKSMFCSFMLIVRFKKEKEKKKKSRARFSFLLLREIGSLDSRVVGRLVFSWKHVSIVCIEGTYRDLNFIYISISEEF